MTTAVFVSMSDRRMASLIADAKRRVAVAVPAIRPLSASVLVAAFRRLPPQSLAVLMDCDEEVFRLGYGDFAALKTLREANVPVRQSSGLRIGVLVSHKDPAFDNFVPGAFDRAKTLVEFRIPGMVVDDGGRAMRKLHQYVKIAEAAEILGVCQNTLRKSVDEGRIQARVNPANGYRLFQRKDLDTFLTKASQLGQPTRKPK